MVHAKGDGDMYVVSRIPMMTSRMFFRRNGTVNGVMVYSAPM